MLGIKLPTLQMVYDELRQSSRQKGIDEIKGAIFVMNDLLESKSTSLDPGPVLKAEIFPLEYPKGSPVLRSIDTDFAIGDRTSLKERFRGKITLLDFDLEEVCHLRPFFEWAGLQNRYLSNMVREETHASDDSGRPVRSESRDLKRKAYYILRYAADYMRLNCIEADDKLA